MDILGARAGYRQFFGTKDQPNKPACTTVQVVLPAGERGALIEIDLVAVRPKQLRSLAHRRENCGQKVKRGGRHRIDTQPGKC
jgi:hypothetical protein